MKRIISILSLALLIGAGVFMSQPVKADVTGSCYVRITWCSFGSGLKLKCADDATLDTCRRYNCITCDLETIEVE